MIGESDHEIAVFLQIGEGEVEARVAGILEKLGLKDRSLMSLMLPKES